MLKCLKFGTNWMSLEIYLDRNSFLQNQINISVKKRSRLIKKKLLILFLKPNSIQFDISFVPWYCLSLMYYVMDHNWIKFGKVIHRSESLYRRRAVTYAACISYTNVNTLSLECNIIPWLGFVFFFRIATFCSTSQTPSLLAHFIHLRFISCR